jgi:hypothetical protein
MVIRKVRVHMLSRREPLGEAPILVMGQSESNHLRTDQKVKRRKSKSTDVVSFEGKFDFGCWYSGNIKSRLSNFNLIHHRSHQQKVGSEEVEGGNLTTGAYPGQD